MRSDALSWVFLVVPACYQTSGPQPDDYGLPCDPTASEPCSSGMHCVPLEGHFQYLISPLDGEFACAMPCTEDSDCPKQICGDGIGGGAPYECMEDGYCIIYVCDSSVW